jgi:hypothetical protein
MKFKIGDHLQEIGNTNSGIVTDIIIQKAVIWYLIRNDELRLINHWVPEGKLELHKQTLREGKLKELGIEKTSSKSHEFYKIILRELKLKDLGI